MNINIQGNASYTLLLQNNVPPAIMPSEVNIIK